MNAWERFNTIANTDEVATAQAQFKPLDEGTYAMKLEKIEAGTSKSGLPMLKAQLRTDTNKVVFYNQMLQNLNNPEMTATNIAKAITFVGALNGREIEFTNLGTFADDVSKTPTGEMYSVKVTYGKKDTEHQFANLTIVSMLDSIRTDGDCPFDS